MPRPDPADVDRYHHLDGIPSKFQKVLYTGGLRYSAHANIRYARRVEHHLPAAARPTLIKAQTMQLLAADVVDGQVVMQVWRVPLDGVERDLVLAVSDQGKVATVWVVERNDPDGIKRQKLSRPERRAARLARSLASESADLEAGQAVDAQDDQALVSPAPADFGGSPATRWRAPWAWVCRAIRNVLTPPGKQSCLKNPRFPP